MKLSQIDGRFGFLFSNQEKGKLTELLDISNRWGKKIDLDTFDQVVIDQIGEKTKKFKYIPTNDSSWGYLFKRKNEKRIPGKGVKISYSIRSGYFEYPQPKN